MIFIDINAIFEPLTTSNSFIILFYYAIHLSFSKLCHMTQFYKKTVSYDTVFKALNLK